MKKPFLLFVVTSGIAMLLCAFSSHFEKAHSVTPFLFNIPAEIPSPYEPVDNPTTMEGVALGKKLFFDNLLSADHTVSCATCHNPEKYFTDAQTLSSGIESRKAKRNSMPLFNMAWVNNFFWDGRVHTLEEVIRFPLTDTNEMGKNPEVLLAELNSHNEYRMLFKKTFGANEITLTKVNKALAQYLRSITSYHTPLDSLYPVASSLMKKDQINQPAAMKKLFGFSDHTIKTLTLCEKCHGNITYGNNSMRNNGLDENNGKDKGLGGITSNEKELGLFKAPSFRNLIYTGPYMHDGRFTTLEEVIEHYNSGIKANPNLDPLLKDENGKPVRLSLTQREKDELLYFLKVLMTDNNLSYN